MQVCECYNQTNGIGICRTPQLERIFTIGQEKSSDPVQKMKTDMYLMVQQRPYFEFLMIKYTQAGARLTRNECKDSEETKAYFFFEIK